MKSSDLIALLLLVIVGGVAYKVYTEYGRKMPPNARVNEDTYGKLETNMGKPAVEALLGLPHQVAHGRVVAAEAQYAPDIHSAIDQQKDSPEELNIYEGQNDERILVLFSKDGKAVAVEYAIGESPVLYKGPAPTESKTAPRLAPRVCQNEKEAAEIAQFQRRLQLKQQAAAQTPAAPASQQAASPTPSSDRPRLPGGDGQETRQPSAKAPADGSAYRPADAPKFTLTLPSGAVLSNTMMDVPENWQASNLPHSAQVYVMPYPGGATHGIFATKEGRCHGASAFLYPGGSLCTLAYYNKGQLSGPVRLWSADRTRLLYAEYVNGQRHGPLCFFAGDVPCLVQEWKYGKLAAEYFVKDADLDGVPIPKSELSPESDDGRQFLARQQRLDDLLAEIEQNEKTIKQNIANWYRKECERQRRERAISQSAAKREAILSRTEGRNAAKAAAWELQLQHALRTW